MKSNYIKALCIAGSVLFFFAALNGGVKEASASAGRDVRAGVCLGIDEVAMSEEKHTVSAGVTDALGMTVEEAWAVATVSDTHNILTASAEEPQAQEAPKEPETVYGYQNLVIAVVDSHLNVRETPSTDAEMVGKMPNRAACEILAQEGEWYQIVSGEVSGYVSGEFLKTGEEAVALAEEVKRTVARSTTMTLNVREQPNTDCNIITTIAEGEELEVIEELDGWVKVLVDSDEGYICADYVEILVVLPRAMTMTEAKYGLGVSDVRVELAEFACQYVGYPYVWGGTSLTNGADCSGFVLSVFANYGISLPHNAAAQSAYGRSISASEAKPGDLFFYGNGYGINHVAIYIGNGQVVHASTERTGIKISNSGYRTPVKVTSLLD